MGDSYGFGVFWAMSDGFLGAGCNQLIPECILRMLVWVFRVDHFVHHLVEACLNACVSAKCILLVNALVNR